MSKNSIRIAMPFIVIVVLILCLFINHSIKKKAFDDAVDETLIKHLMVGASTEISKDDFGYLICTEDNIKNISITRKSVHIGLFSRKVLVDFDITVETAGKTVNTTGALSLDYDKNKKTRWRVAHRTLRNEGVTIS